MNILFPSNSFVIIIFCCLFRKLFVKINIKIVLLRIKTVLAVLLLSGSQIIISQCKIIIVCSNLDFCLFTAVLIRYSHTGKSLGRNAERSNEAFSDSTGCNISYEKCNNYNNTNCRFDNFNRFGSKSVAVSSYCRILFAELLNFAGKLFNFFFVVTVVFFCFKSIDFFLYFCSFCFVLFTNFCSLSSFFFSRFFCLSGFFCRLIISVQAAACQQIIF